MVDTILFLIRSLNLGGAERQLVMLARGLRERDIEVTVATFYPGGALMPELREAGVRLIDLRKRGRWDVLAFLWRLVLEIRKARPTVLYCFLTTANVLGVSVRLFTGVPRVVWGVRASDIDLRRYDRLARAETCLAARLARHADLIICNSSAGCESHAQLGYPRRKMHVVPNGIDTNLFHFDATSRARMRSYWGIHEDDTLIGIVARLDPMKDYESFLRAAAILADTGQRVRFVCVGGGRPQYARQLHSRATALGLDTRLVWAGERSDTASVYSALDILCSSSSFGEGFSNVIAEAMACERNCVVTEVGDSRWIVGDTGRVVSPRQPEALASACEELMAMPISERRDLGVAARRRVQDLFSVPKLIEGTAMILGL